MVTSAVPQDGVTVQAHINALADDIEATVSAVFARLRDGKRLGPSEREAISRRLAGVIASSETVRIWLASGAPR